MSELDNLTDGQREFFLPAGYRFFEQVRLGEYEHNLQLLAELIAGETVRTPMKGMSAALQERHTGSTCYH